MIRRLLYSTLTALALLGAGTAQAQNSGRPAARPAAAKYTIQYRKPGQLNWNTYGSYTTYQSASTTAQNLHRQGYEVHIHTAGTVARVPARPKTANMPVGYTVTPRQAIQVFRWMASQRDIAFRYPTDGCYARAHLMILRMQKAGFKPAKVWSFANGEELYVRTPNIPRGYVTWKYHVAPILRVRLKDGRQRWYVIDPALFKAPATLTYWRKMQIKPGSKHVPYVTLTYVGHAPKDIHGRRLPGSGYWPGHDPKEGLNVHAVKTMRSYKPYEGRNPPRSVSAAPRPTLSSPRLMPGSRNPALAERRRAA
jgi:hypothetical protein